MLWSLWTLVALYFIYKLVTRLLSSLRVGDYTSKHVLITGCDSGFGNLLAKRLDGLGFNVFAACLTSEGAEKLQGACSGRVTTLILDVTDDKSIAAARQFVENKLPARKGLWGLVNNAGVVGAVVPSQWLTKSDWNNCLSVNLFGVIDVTQAFLPLVRKAQGRVVNMASMFGRIAFGVSPYGVSKYGVEAFSDCLRREVYNQGIKVCILEPGVFKTDLTSPKVLVDSFKRSYDATPHEVRKPYEHINVETYAKMMQLTHAWASDDLNLVVNAYEVALTSRFPPTRQLVGNDARFFFRLLWNLPTPLADWIIDRNQRAAQ